MIQSCKTVAKFAVTLTLLTVAASNATAAGTSSRRSSERAIQQPVTTERLTQQPVRTEPTATAQSPEASEINWSVLASGGGQVTLGSMKLGSTIGQTVTGAVSLGSGRLISGFWQNFVTAWEDCCIPPTVSDVNQSGSVDITDISVMIDHQFLTLTPLVCEEEGDVDFSGEVDITDLSVMIDNQFLTLTPLLPCP
jgi:hypothetical protein